MIQKHNNKFYPGGDIHVPPFEVPYYSQFTSPTLVLDIIRGSFAAEDDPLWEEFGAKSKIDYAYWSRRACGIACLKSVVEYFDGPKKTIMHYISKGLEIRGYIFKEKLKGEKPSGWVHAALVKLAEMEGFHGHCEVVSDLKDITRHISENRLVIASVSHELGEWGNITMNRGHLVLVHGYSLLDGQVECLRIHNPSGRYTELQANSWIHSDRFNQAFNGRIIVFYKRITQLS